MHHDVHRTPCTARRARGHPRRQVEHPVTEGITGANLPSLQLIVAMGINLTKLPPSMEINKFLVDVNNPSKDNPFERHRDAQLTDIAAAATETLDAFDLKRSDVGAEAKRAASLIRAAKKTLFPSR